MDGEGGSVCGFCLEDKYDGFIRCCHQLKSEKVWSFGSKDHRPSSLKGSPSLSQSSKRKFPHNLSPSLKELRYLIQVMFALHPLWHVVNEAGLLSLAGSWTAVQKFRMWCSFCWNLWGQHNTLLEKHKELNVQRDYNTSSARDRFAGSVFYFIDLPSW